MMLLLVIYHAEYSPKLTLLYVEVHFLMEVNMCSPNGLTRLISQYKGSPTIVGHHPVAHEVLLSEGLSTVLTMARANWLLNRMALHMAPAYQEALRKGAAGLGRVRLEVFPRMQGGSNKGPAAELTLVLPDESIGYAESRLLTDFPVGIWTFYLASLGEGRSLMHLPFERLVV